MGTRKIHSQVVKKLINHGITKPVRAPAHKMFALRSFILSLKKLLNALFNEFNKEKQKDMISVSLNDVLIQF